MNDDKDVETIVKEILSQFDVNEKSKQMLTNLTDDEFELADLIKKRLNQGYSLVDGVRLVNQSGEQIDLDTIKEIEAAGVNKAQAETHRPEPCCSFCGKKQHEVARLIESQISKTLICDVCVKASLSLLKE